MDNVLHSGVISFTYRKIGSLYTFNSSKQKKQNETKKFESRKKYTLKLGVSRNHFTSFGINEKNSRWKGWKRETSAKRNKRGHPVRPMTNQDPLDRPNAFKLCLGAQGCSPLLPPPRVSSETCACTYLARARVYLARSLELYTRQFMTQFQIKQMSENLR